MTSVTPTSSTSTGHAENADSLSALIATSIASTTSSGSGVKRAGDRPQVGLHSKVIGNSDKLVS